MSSGKKAIQHYERLVEQDPTDIRLLQKLGEVCQKGGDNIKAAAAFARVGECYERDGFFLKAVALLKQVMKLDPESPGTNFKLGVLHLKLGLLGEAACYFQRVLAEPGTLQRRNRRWEVRRSELLVSVVGSSRSHGPMTLTAAEQIAVDLVWKTFSTSGEWPPRHALVVALDDAGFTLYDARAVVQGIATSPSHDSTSTERARLSMRGWESAPAAKHLLLPLGQVVARLARNFIENPTASDVAQTGAAWSTFADLWPLADEWNQITAIVRAGLGGPIRFHSQGGEEMFCHLSVEILRYERVQSFEDVVRTSMAPLRRTRVGQYPAGKYRDLLLRAFAHAREHHEWPRAFQFAVKERELGFIPDLHRDLSDSGFLRVDFSSHSLNRIELKPEAVSTVDDTGQGRELLLKVVDECRARWRQAPGTALSSTELAKLLGVEEGVLKPWLLFLEWSEWRVGLTLEGRGPWIICPNEMVLRYRGVALWEEYLEIPARWRESDLLDIGESGAAPQVVVPDLSAAKDRLRRILCQDRLAEVIEARLDEFNLVCSAEAWQSATIILGSAMEGVLLDVLRRNEGKAVSALPNKKRAPKLEDVGLGDLVSAAESLNLVHSQAKQLALGLKEFRDLVHPNRAATSTYRASGERVRACAIAFENVVGDLDQAIDDGRIQEFER